MNKKGVVGETITWVFAFLFIFLLTLIFLALSTYFAAYKRITFSQNSLEISGGDYKSLNDYRILPTILNYPFEDGIPAEKKFLDWSEGELGLLFAKKFKDKYYFRGGTYSYLYYVCGKEQMGIPETDPTAVNYMNPIPRTTFLMLDRNGKTKEFSFVYFGRCEDETN